MATNVNQVSVLNDLPLFTGNPRTEEKQFTPDIDARTFMRSLENYFLQHNIKSDQRKLQIFSSCIDKRRGDAKRLLSSYVGNGKPWQSIKKNFLRMYPCIENDQLQEASNKLTNVKIELDNMFMSITQLEEATRHVTEAYLKNEAINKGDFDYYTALPAKEGAIPPLECMLIPNTGSEGRTTRQPAQPSTSSADASTDEEQAEMQAAEATLETIIVPDRNSSTPHIILLKNLVQNCLMQIILANQTPHKLYNKLAKIGPREDGETFMGLAVEATEQYRAQTGRTIKKPSEQQIWAVRQEKQIIRNKTNGPMQNRQTQVYKQKNYNNNSTNYNSNNNNHNSNNNNYNNNNNRRNDNSMANVICHNCRNKGHLKKNCRICSYCRIYGHTSKDCTKRKSDNRGKFCTHCQIKDSHNLQECKKKLNYQKQNKNVRIIQEEQVECEQYADNADANNHWNEHNGSQYYDNRQHDDYNDTDESN